MFLNFVLFVFLLSGSYTNNTMKKTTFSLIKKTTQHVRFVFTVILLTDVVKEETEKFAISSLLGLL